MSIVSKSVTIKWEIDPHNSCDLIARIHCGYSLAEENLERLNSVSTIVVINQEQTSCSILGERDS